MYRIVIAVFIFALFSGYRSRAQQTQPPKPFTHADTLRGSDGPGRSWWDVIAYNLDIIPDSRTRTIRGTNEIMLKVLKPGSSMQIDMQAPMQIDSVFLVKYGRSDPAAAKDVLIVKQKKLSFKRDGNAWFVRCPLLPLNTKQMVKVFFHGHPVEAVHPPWDGGWIWTKDRLGRPWISVACQGLGASCWYPCKDYQGDEPDSGASMRITVPDTLVAVSNGRCIIKGVSTGQGTATYVWEVTNPINNYDLVPYIGKYVTWHEDYAGEKGRLDCDYWVLDYNVDKAKEQFKQVPDMLRCFEYWFGPYPFYEDGYKLVEAPHLGMEHQSAVAYGNGFANGYKGRDLSGTGWGLKWDFIIVHESGHEWFGNSITTKDLADMWVHEGFTNYSETLFTTCRFGVQAGNDYVIGSRKLIQNDRPIIAAYGVNQEGSEDMYYKAANMLHIIRQLIADDSVFRELLHGINRTFYHQTVTSAEIEAYMSRETGKDLSKIFDQYLRTPKVPVLEYKVNGNSLRYRWANVVKGFDMPVRIHWEVDRWISPQAEWKTLEPGPGMRAAAAGSSVGANGGAAGNIPAFSVDSNFYIKVRKLD